MPDSRAAPAFPGLGEVAGELEALGLAAAQGGDRLAEPHVLETDRDQGLERALHLGLLAKEGDGLGGGHVEHVGDGAGPPGSSAAGLGRQQRDFRAPPGGSAGRRSPRSAGRRR